MAAVPELPGNPVPRYSEQEQWLKEHVAKLCRLDHDRFPGSQPVSFGEKDLTKLEQYDFWVCEKSDGVRVLFLIAFDPGSNTQAVFLIDRHNTYREIEGFCFPHHEDPRKNLKNSLIDGELVMDVDPRTRQQTLRFLAFDCLVIDDQNVMTKTLDKRYGRLKEWFYRPFARMTKEYPQMAVGQPFDIKVKDINFSYHVEKVFTMDIPNLMHGNDGLIYTCVTTPYTPGTDHNILKWKPPSENSIDFKLVLRFPPAPDNPNKPDFCAKPLFLLSVWLGGDGNLARYEHFDDMYVSDDEWDQMKMSGEQIDDRIVEVHWDPSLQRWRMMRFRDDKPQGNHKKVVDNIIQSIADGVEKDALLARSNAIRNAWKTRAGLPTQPVPPVPPPSNRPPPPLTHGGYPPAHQQPMPSKARPPPPSAELRYGPLPPGPWSKVAGPEIVCGMRR
ncbi:mRNA guanylyltransferase [Coprinellus micaceus]|uniref:mRNA-capping enzyme subunit alpha n=1 Tax=Coprinellus micaceus TaxID=71717 RepID=A0A4Y7TZN2_COPMI|nr:mRNA guanylyltransferase [Coprinellus micaceus]